MCFLNIIISIISDIEYMISIIPKNIVIVIELRAGFIIKITPQIHVIMLKSKVRIQLLLKSFNDIDNCILKILLTINHIPKTIGIRKDKVSG